MKIGMTGGRSGASSSQLLQFRNLLEELKATELHHGDCVGADTQAHDIARELGLRVVIYPPTDSKARAWCAGDVYWSPRPYLKRNHDIVDNTELLIALPDRPEVGRGSGTWATIRYARRVGKEVRILER